MQNKLFKVWKEREKLREKKIHCQNEIFPIKWEEREKKFGNDDDNEKRERER